MILNKLLTELDELWNLSDDPRLKGEYPGCLEIQEKLIPIFNDMSDDELMDFLQQFPKEKLPQIAFPLDETRGNHPCVEPYVQY